MAEGVDWLCRHAKDVKTKTQGPARNLFNDSGHWPKAVDSKNLIINEYVTSN